MPFTDEELKKIVEFMKDTAELEKKLKEDAEKAAAKNKTDELEKKQKEDEKKDGTGGGNCSFVDNRNYHITNTFGCEHEL